MANKSVLITGVAGFIGSHLAEECLRLGWRVTGIDALTDYYARDLKRSNIAVASADQRFTFVEGDLLDTDLVSLLDGVSVIFHLAAQPGVRVSWDDFSIYTRANIEASQRLLDAAQRVPIDRVVLASSSSVYGNADQFPTSETVSARPISPYGVTKLAMEHLARVFYEEHALPTVCLRYFTTYGPRQRPDMGLYRMIEAGLTGGVFHVYGDGLQTRDYTFVGDVVRGTVATGRLGVPGMAYNIGGGSRLALNSVFTELERLLGARVQREYVERQAGDARDTGADIGLARSVLKFEPAWDFTMGLSAQVEWQRSGLRREGLDAVSARS